MHYVVDAGTFLAMALSGEKTEISFRDLRTLWSKSEGLCPDVILDLSAPSINLALEYYPEVFRRGERCVARADNAENFFNSDYIQNEFLSVMPKGVSETLERLLGAA